MKYTYNKPLKVFKDNTAPNFQFLFERAARKERVLQNHEKDNLKSLNL